MKGKIAEIFESIQGEGLYFGERQLFVRFFGCNIQCTFCDTDLKSFAEFEPEDVMTELKRYPGRFHSISFTGGEPLMQSDFLKELAALTRSKGFLNYLDTNATLPADLEKVINEIDIVSMDIKMPSSTGCLPYWQAHRECCRITRGKEAFLKAVICESTTEEDLITTADLIAETDVALMLVLQPNSLESYDMLSAKLSHFRDMCSQKGVTCCILPQMHKIMGVK